MTRYVVRTSEAAESFTFGREPRGLLSVVTASFLAANRRRGFELKGCWRIAGMILRPSIVLFGDSITQYAFGEGSVCVGWASLLASAYQRRADVLSRGYSGYNTRHALEIAPRVLGGINGEVLFTTVFFGANDAALPGERQHIPIREYTKNLEAIIETIRKSYETKVIIITPPPVDGGEWNDRSNDVTRDYGLEAKRVGQSCGCLVLDTWALLGGQNPGFERHLCDGLHLSESGNRLVYEGLQNLIQSECPDLMPQKKVDGKYEGPGIPVEEKLWHDLC